MPSTSRWGLRYPALADAPNGPAQVQALAEDVDDDLGGVIPVLSTARPPHKSGRVIRETDTGQQRISDGTNWLLLAGTVPAWEYVGGNGQVIGDAGTGLGAVYVPGARSELVGVTGTAAGVACFVDITQTGRYAVSFGGALAAGGTAGARSGYIQVERPIGTNIRRLTHFRAVGAEHFAWAVAADLRLTAGDRLVPFIHQKSGGNLNTTDVGLELRFSGTLLSL